MLPPNACATDGGLEHHRAEVRSNDDTWRAKAPEDGRGWRTLQHHVGAESIGEAEEGLAHCGLGFCPAGTRILLQPSRCLFQDLCARDGLWSSMGDDDDDDDDFLGVMPLDGAGRRRKKRVSSASACPIPIRLR